MSRKPASKAPLVVKHLIWWAFLMAATMAYSQGSNAPLNEEYYHRIDRYEVKSGTIVNELFTSVKPYKRSAIVAMMDTLQARGGLFQSSSDQFNLEYLRNDSWEFSHAETSNSRKPLWKSLYKKKSDMFYVDQPDFDLHVSPVLYLGAGKDSRLGNPLYLNTRGVEIRGMIDRKISFYTYFSDNQSRLPAYATDYSNINGYHFVPHQGYWKAFGNGGVDYFEMRGYIDFNLSKSIWVQFGYDRTNIGNGLRSLIQSDFAPPNLFLRTNAKVWKLNYFFQLNKMTATNNGPNRYPEKFMAFHHLSMNLGKKFNLGLFESIVFSPQDSINGGVFELNYLNPVIFYRAVEQQNGSADNALLGIDWKWLARKRLSIYGQFVLDEFVLSHMTSGDGWWANKFSVQAGLKYIDVAGIANLDLQLEGNLARPYTYTHQNQFTSYTSFMQPIAHPLGANFYELAAVIRYQPLPKLTMTMKTIYTRTGRDQTGTNWGGDINKSYNTRQQDYNNKIAQGTDNKIIFIDFLASYMLRHNFYIDLKQTFRNSSSPDPRYNNNTSLTSVALRWNIAAQSFDF